MRSDMRRLTVVALVALFAVGGAWISSPTATAQETYSATALLSDAVGYQSYSAQTGYPYTGKTIEIDVLHPVASVGAKVEKISGFNALCTEGEGYVEWAFSVPETGKYAVEIQYFPLSGSGGAVQRTIVLDGEIPFAEAYGVELARPYKDSVEIEHIEDGDDLRPSQTEAARWMTTQIRDVFGYFGDRLYFSLDASEHTLRLESLKEPMAIRSVRLCSKETVYTTYEEYLQKAKADGAEEITGIFENGVSVLQAENATLKSDSTLAPSADRTSPATQPYDYRYQRLNTIGGSQWKYPGQWIVWEIDVPQDGLYQMGLRYKQNYNQDLYSNRTLYIDGEMPFEQASQLQFLYNSRWSVGVFGDTQPYLFYLKKGRHELKLEVTLGTLCDTLMRADECLKNLNQINLKFLAFFGSSPDQDRDYRLKQYMPDTLTELEKQAKELDGIIEEVLAITGKRGANIGKLEQLSEQIRNIVREPDRIASLYSRFKDSIGTFGEWIMTAREQPLLIDCLFLAEKGADLPQAEPSFFASLANQVMLFLDSFVSDYSALDKQGVDKEIIVWMGNTGATATTGSTGGRDQAQVLKKMVSQEFTPQSEISVNVQLVPAGSILPAILSGKGPDVSLQMAGSDPVNYAMRGALKDLSEFSDFEQVAERFLDGALLPYEYLGGTYALPETMSFPMLFYRKDILNTLGVDIDSLQTWDDVFDILPELQKSNMNIGLPSSNPQQNFAIFLYQSDGEYYINDGKTSGLSEKVALDAFSFWMNLYSNYGLPKDYSFENRFRTGEMPLGIADYTTYNLLSISAPEIRGQWGMTVIPGTRRSDGSINYVAPVSGAGCMMLEQTEDAEACWEFMKWWTSADVQYEFGQELENLMGTAARYNTANIEALERLPWGSAERRVLLKQTQQLHGIPEVPGSYYTSRCLDFAVRAVFNNGMDARESLKKYARQITTEITTKRKEFGLDF